jgi:hypothetical protein
MQHPTGDAEFERIARLIRISTSRNRRRSHRQELKRRDFGPCFEDFLSAFLRKSTRPTEQFRSIDLSLGLQSENYSIRQQGTVIALI